MFTKKIALAALFAGVVYAQGSSSVTSSSPSPTESLSPCLLSCITGATQCTPTDTTCVCTNQQYQAAVLTCLQTKCTAADLQEAQALDAATCGASSSVSSGHSSVSSVVSHPSSASQPSSTHTGTTGSSGGAIGLSSSILATGGAVLLGVIGGGMLVF
ncbi:hypothetical protein BDM02DRAFT_3119913 [Thelephora ganbajun]|uniref:Uncharacterized protein n=1 Tax=Thelephora ganbajun TaxID=370292 RepID=A0ACB6Z7Z8_THEGA|nr:hypothetical protein BDM02DRAFT_3119913 [Thelephora ganbajun]